jgi:GTPase involved in cell partitioning and DNA repair
MIEIIDDLSRLSLKLTTKYRIIDLRRSHFLSEEQNEEESEKSKKESNNENKSIKNDNSSSQKIMTKAIMSED